LRERFPFFSNYAVYESPMTIKTHAIYGKRTHANAPGVKSQTRHFCVSENADFERFALYTERESGAFLARLQARARVSVGAFCVNGMCLY
jgi:hypothetical protein